MKIEALLCFAVLMNEHSFAKNWNDVADRCFCKLQGSIDDCSCKVETLDSFNNNKVYPRLKSLLSKNYFRYFKVNLKKGCPFWSLDKKCTVRDCHVDVSSKDEIPIRTEESSSSNEEQASKYLKESSEVPRNADESCAMERELSALDTTISDEEKSEFQSWKQFDETLSLFCEIDDETSNDLEYVDLLKNPERYTGYKGTSAHRIWKSIYEENCFKSDNSVYEKDASKSYGPGMSSNSSMCLEKRVFYHLISGLHTSINVHLSDNYLFSAKAGFGTSKWDHNLKEFLSRFDPELTDGQGPERLKNLYFAYLIELRALAKAKPYFTQEQFYTGYPSEDNDVKEGALSLLDVIQTFPDHFNETELFKGNTKEKRQLKAEFVEHFRNISRIMDCVECDKCKLWGKLQILGMGTALKILFSQNVAKSETSRNNGFQLTRSEIVAFFNAFGRLSSSIYAIETFRKLAGKVNGV